MDALTKVQIVWTETKDLRVPAGGDPATLSTLRRTIAAIASDAEKTFSRFEAIPARDDDLYGPDVVDCATAAEASPATELKDLRVILWPSADGKTLSKEELAPPSPWDSAEPVSMELIGRFEVEGHSVSAFSRRVGEQEDTPRFVSLATGTGLPPDTGVYVPREKLRRKVDPKVGRIAFWCAMLAVVLFGAACLWSLSIGNLTRTAQNIFAVSSQAQSCPTSIVPGTPNTLYGAPLAWLPTATGAGTCMTAWQTAWGLIGISGGTTILSSFITQPGTPSTPAPAGTVIPPRRTRILSNPDPKDAELADLVYGETAEDEGAVDSTRVQAVVVTGVLAAIYVNLALEASERIGGLTLADAVNSGAQVFANMPPAGATFLWLLGISHGALLGGKLIGAYKGGGT